MGSGMDLFGLDHPNRYWWESLFCGRLQSDAGMAHLKAGLACGLRPFSGNVNLANPRNRLPVNPFPQILLALLALAGSFATHQKLWAPRALRSLQKQLID